MADGYLTFNTKLNTTGFKAGLGSLTSAFGKLAALAGVAFSVAAVVQFGKAGVQAASEMGAKFKGLEFLMKANNRSMSQATAFLQSFTSDGLVPMTSAYEAYKNMVSRGYSTDQIEKMLAVMKDAAVYNRQGQFSMGEAMEKATTGLRMENSLLTDSVGIQKNVAKMWQEYAQEIGTTANNLTMVQKRQAEFNGFMREGGVFAGAAGEYAGSYAGKIATISASFLNLKIAVGNAIIPIINALLPSINAAILWFTKLFNIVGRVMNLLFGTNVGMVDAEKAVADSAQAGADAMGEMADNTEKAGEAAKGSLAAFDKINVLSQSDKGGGAGAGAGVGAGGILPTKEDTGGASAALDEVGEKIEAFFNTMKAEGWAAAFKDLFKLKSDEENGWTRFGKFVDKVSKFFEDLKTWGFEPAFNGLFNLPPNALSDFAAIVVAVTLVGGLIASIVALGVGWPAAIIAGLVIIAVAIYRNWDDIVAWIKQAWEDLKGFFVGIWDYIVGLVKAKLAEELAEWEIWKAWIKQAWEDIKGWVAGAWDYIVGLVKSKLAEELTEWESWKAWIVQAWTDIKNWIEQAWIDIKGFFTGAWNAIKLVWDEAVNWFQTTILDPISTAFETAWGAIKGFMESPFEGLGEFVKGIFNNVIGFINGLLSGIVSGINGIIDRINSLSFTPPQWAQDLLGVGTVGVSIGHLSTPQIPYLAGGAVIPPNAPFAAVLGDQKRGTNVEAPLSTIEKAVENALNKRGFADNQASTLHNVIKLDGQVLYDAFQKIDKRVGTSMAKAAGAA